MPQRGTKTRRSVLALVLLLAWLSFLVLAVRTFGPDSIYTNFNSDSAILILMANHDRPVTVFDTYYYAADRWGGWPLLLAKVVHLKTGLHWTDQRLHYVRTIWVFLGLLVLAALNARAAPAVIVSALIVICLEPTSRRIMFDLSQLYSWQLPALFLAWFCMRRLLRHKSDEAAPNGILWSAAFYFSALFAIWSSVASTPLLAVLVTLEALRSHFLFKNTLTTRRIVLAVVLLLSAAASEYLMKMNYHRYSLKRFSQEYRTVMALDFGYLSENLLTNWHNVVQYHFFPFIVLAICFVVGTAGLTLYARVTGKGALLARFFADETVTMIIALTAMAATNFVLMIFVSHVRTSFYNVRFHALTYLFGAISGLLVIYLGIRFLADRLNVTRYVIPLVVVGAFILLGFNFPPRVVNESYKLDTQTALVLAEKTPGAVLMGEYWQTYLFAGLQPTNTMTPLPLEGILNRIPWTPVILNQTEEVVIEYRNSGVVPKDSLPPNELLQYGNLLKLQEARFYENGPYAFALYRNESRKPYRIDRIP